MDYSIQKSTINIKSYLLFLSIAVLLLASSMPFTGVHAGQFENRTLELSSSSTVVESYEIGDTGAAGGLIFYVDEMDEYSFDYLEAAPEGWGGSNDNPSYWGCEGDDIPDAEGDEIGDGASNTQAILSECSQSSIAAELADDYSVNGYDDWFLPSIDELERMYTNLHQEDLGGFGDYVYWSSTQHSSSLAKGIWFDNGNISEYGKESVSPATRPARVGVASPVEHTFSFDIATTASIGAFRFEYCEGDPFPGEPCTAPAGMEASGFEITSQTGASGFAKDPASTTPNEIVVSNSSLQSLSSGDPVTFEFSDIINPTEANQEYYVRLYSYDGDDITTANVVDDGGLAFSTAEVIDITARVQETLQFCVYTGADCNAGGTVADLGILNTTTTQTAESYFDVGTNARNGMNVRLVGDTLTSGSESIEPIGSTFTEAEPGTEQFGFRISAVEGNEQPAESPYGILETYAYVEGMRINVGESDGPVDTTKFTIEYAANVDNLTPTGVYDTEIEFIAVPRF